jgi:hypothetical protein
MYKKVVVMQSHKLRPFGCQGALCKQFLTRLEFDLVAFSFKHIDGGLAISRDRNYVIVKMLCKSLCLIHNSFISLLQMLQANRLMINLLSEAMHPFYYFESCKQQSRLQYDRSAVTVTERIHSSATYCGK